MTTDLSRAACSSFGAGTPRHASRNVILASGVSEDRVDEALEAAAGDARVALVSLLAGIDASAARMRLEASGGSVRKAAGT